MLNNSESYEQGLEHLGIRLLYPITSESNRANTPEHLNDAFSRLANQLVSHTEQQQLNSSFDQLSREQIQNNQRAEKKFQLKDQEEHRFESHRAGRSQQLNDAFSQLANQLISNMKQPKISSSSDQLNGKKAADSSQQSSDAFSQLANQLVSHMKQGKMTSSSDQLDGKKVAESSQKIDDANQLVWSMSQLKLNSCPDRKSARINGVTSNKQFRSKSVTYSRVLPMTEKIVLSVPYDYIPVNAEGVNGIWRSRQTDKPDFIAMSTGTTFERFRADYLPSQNFLNRKRIKYNGCFFCLGRNHIYHTTVNCRVLSTKQKCYQLAQGKFCLKCLLPNHLTSECKKVAGCSICQPFDRSHARWTHKLMPEIRTMWGTSSQEEEEAKTVIKKLDKTIEDHPESL